MSLTPLQYKHRQLLLEVAADIVRDGECSPQEALVQAMAMLRREWVNGAHFRCLIGDDQCN